MNTIETLRPGTTFTHGHESLTITRVVGRTVIARDRLGHTRHFSAERVTEGLAIATRTPRTIDAAAAGTDRVCASLGIPTSAPAVTDAPAVTAEIFHDAEEYLREVFGERAARAKAKTGQPRALAYLFVVPQTTPPRAA